MSVFDAAGGRDGLMSRRHRRGDGRSPVVIVPARSRTGAWVLAIVALLAVVAAVTLYAADRRGLLHRATAHRALARAAAVAGISRDARPVSVAPASGVPAGVVVPNPLPPARPDTIELRITRFTSGSGPVPVSSGIPLAPGALWPGQSKLVRVFVGGVEQSVYVEELAGRHRDGSLRAVLVEFTAKVDHDAPAAGSLVLAQPRRTPDLPPPNPSERGAPVAVVLPADPVYLLGTDIVGPTITVAEAQRQGGAFRGYELNFVKYADKHWAAEGASWTDDYYDRALIYYTWWARTGNAEYWRRGTLMAAAYRRDYLEKNNYFASPHWAQLEGLEKHYLLTGDEASRTAIWKTAVVLHDAVSAKTLDVEWDPRIRGRVLLAYLLSWRLQSAGADWAALLDDGLKRVISTVEADGHVRQYTPCGIMQNNFMVGVQNDALIKIYDYYRADARIPSAVRRSVDYMWATQWNAAGRGFLYMSGSCPGEGGPTPAPDLNNMIVSGFAWIYRRTGDVRYRDHADAAFAASVSVSWLDGSKQFNEQYTNSPRYLYDRRAPAQRSASSSAPAAAPPAER